MASFLKCPRETAEGSTTDGLVERTAGMGIQSFHFSHLIIYLDELVYF